MKMFFLTTLGTVLVIYISLCVILYLFQEKLIFFPEKLDNEYSFHFDQRFEERNVKASDGAILNAVLFKADGSRGVIFYLHGNAGSLHSWGQAARTYTDLGYDVFMLDYREYGKSEGVIDSQTQMFDDVQTAYDELKKYYPEDKIIVLGYSIGTGLASHVASTNQPRLLILQAPYYSLTDMVRHTFPYVPSFLLKYKFETNKYLKDYKAQIVIFHGDKDEVIYYGSSLKLKDELQSRVKLVTLKGQGHNGITENEEYKNELRKIFTGKDPSIILH
jgi:uncharacterized protein